MRALRRVLGAFHEVNGDVSVVEFAVLHDHLHLIVEAADSNALSRGLQGLLVRLARAINGVLERKGRVFADRYHAHVLRTPREVRHAVAYVLHNARKHVGQRARRPTGWLDPCSTAAWFVGFRDAVATDPRSVALAVALGPPCTRGARTWLLREGWRRCGLVSVDEVPRSS